MTTPRLRVTAPDRAARGDVIAIKTLLRHRMETGLRRDSDGNPIPREIINKFVCEYNGNVVFSVDLQPAVSANPYIKFHTVAGHSGVLKFLWYEDGGRVITAERRISVG